LKSPVFPRSRRSIEAVKPVVDRDTVAVGARAATQPPGEYRLKHHPVPVRVAVQPGGGFIRRTALNRYSAPSAPVNVALPVSGSASVSSHRSTNVPDGGTLSRRTRKEIRPAFVLETSMLRMSAPPLASPAASV
jgi:hypothetical protein